MEINFDEFLSFIQHGTVARFRSELEEWMTRTTAVNDAMFLNIFDYELKHEIHRELLLPHRQIYLTP
jgi:hypothetical protein